MDQVLNSRGHKILLTHRPALTKFGFFIRTSGSEDEHVGFSFYAVCISIVHFVEPTKGGTTSGGGRSVGPHRPGKEDPLFSNIETGMI